MSRRKAKSAPRAAAGAEHAIIETTCPVMPLAFEFDTLSRAYNELDEDQTKHREEVGDNKRQMMVIWDRMDAICEQVSYLRPESKIGAAFQIMLASRHMDTLTDVDGEDQRKLETQMMRLFFRAVEYLMTGADCISSTREYCMGQHLNPHALLRTIEESVPVGSVRPRVASAIVA